MALQVRALGAADIAAFDAFLAPHTAEAYFLRSNAKKAGLVYNGEFLQAEYVGAFEAGRLVGVASYSWLDTILVYVERLDVMEPLACALEEYLVRRGGRIEAILGLAPHVDALVRALGLPEEAIRHRAEDGLFKLSLQDLKVPQLAPDMHVRLAQARDEETLVQWRIAFNIEASDATPGPELEDKVRKEIARRLEEKDTYVLEKEGQLVSYCGVGGYIDESVIVGPVWTVPHARCRGYGRKVASWALVLCAAGRPKPVEEAVLFASRADAIKAYEALGFHRFAAWRLLFIREDYRYAGVRK